MPASTAPGSPLPPHQDQPNPSRPATCRFRLRYAKRGRLRFTSHRDVARAVERALRKAGVPMAYSQGFSPHPKISWVGAVPTGVASDAEYVEIALAERVDPVALREELNRALPAGLDVQEVVEAGAGALADRIDATCWRIEFPGVSEATLRSAAAALSAAEHVEIERLTKSGRRTVDIRPAIVSLEVSAQVVGPAEGAAPPESGDPPGNRGVCGILTAVVRQMTPTVRPDDVLSALRVVAALTPPVAPKAARLAQGRLDDAGRLTDPLAADRAAASRWVAGEQGCPPVRR